MKKISAILFLALMMVCLCAVNSDTQTAEAKKYAKRVRASVSKKHLTAGKRLKIHTKMSHVRYSSSDSNIASVSAKGVITGKRKGKVTISVKRAGHQSKKIPLTIRVPKGKPALAVACDEVKLRAVKMKKIDEKQYQYSAIIHNTAKQGKVYQISYYYQIETQDWENDDEKTSLNDFSYIVSEEGKRDDVESKGKTVVLTAKNIKAGEKSSRVYCEGDISGKISAMHLSKIELYTKEVRYTYNVDQGKGSAEWYGEDQTGPVITGWVRKKSSYQGEPLRVCYTDCRGTYDFKKHVKAVDARDGRVAVSVDTSRINWKKEGIYKVYYTAQDASGNQSKTWAKVQVYKSGAAERMADIILKTRIKSGSDVQKLRKIYQYVSGNCSYVGTGPHTNWRAAAVRGIRNHYGDCFTFYSMAKLLIVRSGIPHIMVRRYPAHAGHNHWWNLVYVKGGWYHFDATPRARRGYFCLQTDAQLRMYSTGSTFRFRYALYPKRAKKRISRNPI